MKASNIKDLAATFSDQSAFVALTNEELRHWFDLRLLHSLNNIAEQQNWAENIPPVILDSVSHRGQIFAAPISVHTSNWVWGNKQLVDATGLSMSTNWPEFIDLLNALRDQNVIPIAHDGSKTQDILMFESLYLADFGADKYNLLFAELDPTALRKAEEDFTAVFSKLAQLKPYIQRQPAGTPWQVAANALTSAEAGLVIQGDWVHGEFARQGRIPNQHYYCAPFPGAFESVSFKVDSIASMNSHNYSFGADQTAFFSSVMDKDQQFLFNNYKGGLPAVKDTGLEAVSECLTLAVARTNAAQENNTLVPSLSQGMAVRDVVKFEIGEVINAFMLSDQSPAEAANLLQKRIKYASFLIN